MGEIPHYYFPFFVSSPTPRVPQTPALLMATESVVAIEEAGAPPRLAEQNLQTLVSRLGRLDHK